MENSFHTALKDTYIQQGLDFINKFLLYDFIKILIIILLIVLLVRQIIKKNKK